MLICKLMDLSETALLFECCINLESNSYVDWPTLRLIQEDAAARSGMTTVLMVLNILEWAYIAGFSMSDLLSLFLSLAEAWAALLSGAD